MLYKTYPGSVLTYELIEPLLFAKPKLELTLKDEAPPKENNFPSIFKAISVEECVSSVYRSWYKCHAGILHLDW